MIKSTKVGLMAVMMVLGVLALSGSANAAGEKAVAIDMAVGGSTVNHTCDGLIDANCTCGPNTDSCDTGSECAQYANDECLIGPGWATA